MAKIDFSNTRIVPRGITAMDGRVPVAPDLIGARMGSPDWRDSVANPTLVALSVHANSNDLSLAGVGSEANRKLGIFVDETQRTVYIKRLFQTDV